MPIRRLPYPTWLLAILRPLDNRYTWRLRLRVLEMMDPPWVDHYEAPTPKAPLGPPKSVKHSGKRD